MKCPVDNNDLVMSERSGVEIDYCPSCRGVWLDRGELDKIIDRAASISGAAAAPPVAPPAAPPLPGVPAQAAYGSQRGEYQDDRQRNDRYDRGYDRKYDKYGNQPHKKKEGWLGDLFDF